jgi:uncharacterized protein (UPF0248 family)
VEERKMKKGSKATAKATAKKATVCDMEAVIKGFCKHEAFRDVAEKMLAVMKDELSNRLKKESEMSFVAPRAVDYALVADKLANTSSKRWKKVKTVYIHKGEYYNLSEICAEFGMDYHMVQQRIKILKWDLLRAFGVENHRDDHYITENLLKMKV